MSQSFENMTYTGRDGISRQSTNLDYTEKTKVATATRLTPEELAQLLEGQESFRRSLIERVLAIPASLAGSVYEPFINRFPEERKLEWNAAMIADPGMPLDLLRNMVTILENRYEQFPK